jgi:hypothetical protein
MTEVVVVYFFFCLLLISLRQDLEMIICHKIAVIKSLDSGAQQDSDLISQ